MMGTTTFTVDISGMGSSILNTFSSNTTTLYAVGGALIGFGLLWRWIKRAAK